MTTAMTKKTIGVAAAIALTAGFVSAPAAVGDGGAKSNIKITKLSSTGAAGKVSSSKASCESSGRKVSLFTTDGFISDKIAITHTNSGGSWRVKKTLKEGRYFAKVDASSGCRYDNSRKKTLNIG
jgi:hypothetical protein